MVGLLRLTRAALLTQGAYYVLVGLWPLVSIRTFQIVTGPKIDLWLVRTVAVLTLVIGAAVLLAWRRNRLLPETAVVAIGAALGFAVIDVVYSLGGRISPVYLLDAVAELALAAVLAAAAWQLGREPRASSA